MKNETTHESVLPVVHLNGTSVEALIEQRCDAGFAIRKALAALSETAPNGRDFYPVPGLLKAAEAQYERRVAILRGLLAELEIEVAQLDEIRSERSR